MISSITCPNCKQPLSAEVSNCPHCGAQVQSTQSSAPLAQGGEQSPVALSSQNKSSTVSLSTLTQPLPDILKQFDTTATTNMTIAGVLLGFYSGAIFAGKVLAGDPLYALLYALPLAILLATIISALRVFYPDGYLNDDYLALIKKKEQRLRWSVIFLEIAIALLVIAVFVYLTRPPTTP